MRFSIAGLVVLTVWVALCVNWYRLWSEEIALRREGHAFQEQVASLTTKIAMDGAAAKNESILLPGELSQIQVAVNLEQDFREAFQEYAHEASKVTPRPDKVSVRKIPTLSDSDTGILPELKLAFRIHVPPGLSVKLRLELLDIESGAAVLYPRPAEADWPLLVDLENGFSEIGFRYAPYYLPRYSPTQVSSQESSSPGTKTVNGMQYRMSFSLDGRDQPLFTHPVHANSSNGHSFSHTVFDSQRDISTGSYLLFEIQPSAVAYKLKASLETKATEE